MDEALTELSRKTEQGNLSKKSSIPPKPLPISTQNKQPPSSSQRFRVPALPRSSATPNPEPLTQKQDDVRPWAELYGPCTLDELGIHKKKIQDVQAWLTSALAGKIKQKILVLKGPAGSGKSTTIDLLSRTHKYELVQWRNPDTSESGTLSSSLQFAEFISRGGDYSALSLNTDGESAVNSPSSGRVLLVEDFPASLTWNSTAMESFRSALLQAASNNDSVNIFGKNHEQSSRPPIVLIISETLVSTSTSFTDSFTAQRLLGPELINHHGVSVIEFNPVAPTFLSKALDLVIKKEARDSGRRRIPGSALLQKLADVGDIRNAVNSLQLLCTRGDDTGDWSGTVAARTNTKRGSKSVQPLSKTEENSMKLISSRETTLDMFHAAAKVCYNKRNDSQGDARAQPPPKPPDHLMHLHKAGTSQVDIEDLLSETGTDIQTFISTVHQNYVLSCNNDDFADYLDGCASFLSDSELLDPDSRMFSRSRARASARRNVFQLGTADALRQDEISFNVATRGVLFSLPYPVSRATLPGARKMDTFKMYYPASLRIWKPTEETNDLIDLTIARLSGRLSDRPSGAEDSGVSSWHTRQSAFSGQSVSSTKETVNDDSTSLRLDLHKDSLILDTLPYMTVIKSGRGEDTTMLRKITQLRGFDVSADGDTEEDAIDKPMSATARLSQRVEAVHESIQSRQMKQQPQQKQAFMNPEGKTSDDPQIEKLWIEDDDIEDVDD